MCIDGGEKAKKRADVRSAAESTSGAKYALRIAWWTEYAVRL
jgi:hypothetical protein